MIKVLIKKNKRQAYDYIVVAHNGVAMAQSVASFPTAKKARQGFERLRSQMKQPHQFADFQPF